ncbi:MAG TPA: hypothetical protein VLZ07_10295 [Syntrophales bacterium]|nr:hypothetical protein [Syntrophales bacterium]
MQPEYFELSEKGSGSHKRGRFFPETSEGLITMWIVRLAPRRLYTVAVAALLILVMGILSISRDDRG